MKIDIWFGIKPVLIRFGSTQFGYMLMHAMAVVLAALGAAFSPIRLHGTFSEKLHVIIAIACMCAGIGVGRVIDEVDKIERR